MATNRERVSAYRADIRAGVVVAVAVTALGLPFGLLWHWVSPRAEVVRRMGGVFFTDPEGSAFIAADGWFAAIGAVAGVGCAVVAFGRLRQRGVAAVLGLAVGGVCASLIAWWIGHQLGPESLALTGPAAEEGVRFEAPVDVRAKGVLLVWSMAATMVFLAMTASHERKDELELTDPGHTDLPQDREGEEPREHPDPANQDRANQDREREARDGELSGRDPRDGRRPEAARQRGRDT
jgi:hypothetical protein